MIIAAWRDTTYDIVLFLHLAAVLLAFAPGLVHPLLIAQLREGGEAPRSTLLTRAAANGRRLYFPALIVAGLLGPVLIVLSDDVIEFSEIWVSLAFLVWIAMCGVVSGMTLPAQRALAAGDRAAQRKLDLGDQLAVLLLVVMLYLMVFKPGSDLP